MSAQHTPGPVHIERCKCGHPACSQYTLSTQRSVGFDLADATLYAAAPELLEVAEDICAIMDCFADPYSGFDTQMDNDLEKAGVHEKLTAAIAKARGDVA